MPWQQQPKYIEEDTAWGNDLFAMCHEILEARYDFSSWQVMDMHLTRLFSLVIWKAFAVSGLCCLKKTFVLCTPSFWIVHCSAGQCCWWLKHNYILFCLGNLHKISNKNITINTTYTWLNACISNTLEIHAAFVHSPSECVAHVCVCWSFTICATIS